MGVLLLSQLVHGNSKGFPYEIVTRVGGEIHDSLFAPSCAGDNTGTQT